MMKRRQLLLCCCASFLFVFFAECASSSSSSSSQGSTVAFVAMADAELASLSVAARRMFRRGFGDYISHAYPHDELRPLSCAGRNPFGGVGMTLLDSLDALLAVLGSPEEFERRAADVVGTLLPRGFDIDVNVSAFELNIRALGGLLSAYLLAEERALCGADTRAALLRLAEDLGRRLLPAFETATGIPFGTVNLRHGVPQGETPVTCTAGGASFTLEFGVLSRLTGDRVFDDVARAAVFALWQRRSPLGLLGNHINTATGAWVAVDASVGSATDSFYEYLLKAALLFNDGELLDMFLAAYGAAERYIRKGPWYPHVNPATGGVTMASLDSLAAFWPGMQVLHGDVEEAALAVEATFMHVWRKYGALPELWSITARSPFQGRLGYPLRPELVESLFLLSCAKPSTLRFEEHGRGIIESIEHFARPFNACGYAALRDVRTKQLEDQMDSFFLAETLKYLVALFDHSHWMRSGKYIFTTEAHPIPFQYRFSGPPPWTGRGAIRTPVRMSQARCRNPEWECKSLVPWIRNPYAPQRARRRRLDELQLAKNDAEKHRSSMPIDFVCGPLKGGDAEELQLCSFFIPPPPAILQPKVS